MAAQTSKLQRALPASAFLALGATALYLMDIPTLVFKYEPPSKSGFIFHGNGEKTRMLTNFHWIAPLDEVFRDVTVGFAPSTLGYDQISRWQMINFMLDISIIYMINVLEGLRKGAGFPVSMPAFLILLAQIAGGGFIVPIICFVNVVFGIPLEKNKTNADARMIDIPKAWIYSLGVVLLHCIPMVYMFTTPDMEARHWWVWFWQLYPVRIAMFYYAVRALGSVIPLPLPASQPKSKKSYQKHLFWILSPFILMSALHWVYTLIYCPYPFATAFWPQPLSDANTFDVGTFNERMRRTLIIDQWFSGGCTLLWLLWDEKSLREAVVIAAQNVVLTVAVGPGAAIGILWLVKEEETTR